MGARRRVIAVLTVLVLLGSAVSLLLALTRPDQAPIAERPGQAAIYRPADLDGPGGPALAAAVAALPLALSYDFRGLDASLAAATTTMTAAFAAQFTKTFDERARPLAKQRKAVTEAVVRGAGVVRTQGPSRAVCLLFVDQRLLQSVRLDPGDPPMTLTTNRVLVVVVLRSGTWKIDGIRPI